MLDEHQALRRPRAKIRAWLCRPHGIVAGECLDACSGQAFVFGPAYPHLSEVNVVARSLQTVLARSLSYIFAIVNKPWGSYTWKGDHCYSGSPPHVAWASCSLVRTSYTSAVDAQGLTMHRLRPRRLRRPPRQPGLSPYLQSTRHHLTRPDCLELHRRMHHRRHYEHLPWRCAGKAKVGHHGLHISYRGGDFASYCLLARAYDRWEGGWRFGYRRQYDDDSYVAKRDGEAVVAWEACGDSAVGPSAEPNKMSVEFMELMPM